MVKMFGWEKKIQSRIDEKREDEIRWVLKGRVGISTCLLDNRILTQIAAARAFHSDHHVRLVWCSVVSCT